MIHLVFGASSKGNLTHAFHKQSHQVIGFPVDFSIGPIKDVDQPNGIAAYFAWLENRLRFEWNNCKTDQSDYEQALQQLRQIQDGAEVTIWTCENASEQMGLRFACYLLQAKEINLSCINTYTATQAIYKDREIDVYIRSTDECSAEELAYFYDHFRDTLSSDKRESLAQEGEELLQSSSVVRSWEQGQLTDEPETRDDVLIIECAKKLQQMRSIAFSWEEGQLVDEPKTRDDLFRLQQETSEAGYMRATRLIGAVLGEANQALSDSWIEYRLRTLIQAGVFSYKGKLQAMRMYQVRLEL